MNPWVLVAAAGAVTVTARWRAGAWWTRRARKRLATPRARRGDPGRGEGLAMVLEPIVAFLHHRLRRRVGLADDVAPTLEGMARSVAAGTSLGASLDGLGPGVPERPFAAVLAPVAAEHRLGAPLAHAMGRAGTTTDRQLPEVALGLAVLEVVATHGGARAAALHRAAAAVRERRAVVAERAVQSAQARLSAMVLTLVPIGFAMWTASTDPRVAHFLLRTPFGWACLAVGLGVNLVGWWWMHRVIWGQS